VHDILAVLASFLACSVEMVEALTIVLAVGMTRGWRSTALGVAAALALLTAVVVGLGPALTVLPIDTLRLVVGTILLVFGLQWLRKACLRAAGLKAMHDEDLIFEHEVEEARAAGRARDPSHDWYAFTVAFKGVFLEGLEVAFLVVTFGGSQHNVGLASLGAAAALVVVLAVGAVVHAPLSRVPENTLKFGVGLMLTTFGIFWSVEGAGGRWPGGDSAILALLACLTVFSFGLVTIARRNAAPTLGQAS
jgi:uncharacterized membrane protein